MVAAVDGTDLPVGILGIIALAVRQADAFSREVDVDYEGFWSVVAELRAALPNASEDTVHNVVSGQLLGLAHTGIIGFF